MARALRTIQKQTRSGVRRLTLSEGLRVKRSLALLPYYRQALKIVAGDRLGSRSFHAASFLSHRHVVLDPALLASRRELTRILFHEIFHFLWPRLGNPLRRSFEDLLRREWNEKARGELGWSAEGRKMRLSPTDLRLRTRLWRDYVCESFCDSAAWFCLGGRRGHPEWSLKPRFRRRRQQWFLAADILPRLHS